MEIGPILRALRYNKTRFVLVSLEIALTFAVVVNCVSMMLDTYREMSVPSGLVEEVIFEVIARSYDTAFEDEDFAAAQWTSDLEVLRSLDGVESAAKAYYMPLSGNISASSYRPHGAEGEDQDVIYYPVGEEAVRTYGLEIVEGRDLVAEDFLADQGENQYDANVLVNRAAAERIFPGGDALGRRIGGNEEGAATHTVVGIVAEMTYPQPNRQDFADRAILVPSRLCLGRSCVFVVRATPRAVAGLAALIEEELLARHSGRRVFVESMAHMRREIFSYSRLLIQALTGVMALLLFVTTLGIVGVTSFSVTQRTRQIGTRRALGARRQDILRYFLVESFLVTSAGLLLGGVLSFVLNYFLTHQAAAARLEWPLLGVGMAVLYGVGLGSTLVPALRGTRVAPVVATRCV